MRIAGARLLPQYAAIPCHAFFATIQPEGGGRGGRRRASVGARRKETAQALVVAHARRELVPSETVSAGGRAVCFPRGCEHWPRPIFFCGSCRVARGRGGCPSYDGSSTTHASTLTNNLRDRSGTAGTRFFYYTSRHRRQGFLGMYSSFAWHTRGTTNSSQPTPPPEDRPQPPRKPSWKYGKRGSQAARHSYRYTHTKHGRVG